MRSRMRESRTSGSVRGLGRESLVYSTVEIVISGFTEEKGTCIMIQAQTLVIAGKKDIILELHTRLIADTIPNSQLVFINGNHFIANKNPEEFNRVVLEFLK